MAISKTKQLELLTARLLNLDPNITIKKIKLTPYGEVVYLEIPLPKIRVCTKCGSNNCNIDAWEEHTFKHFPINNRKIFLHVDNRRLKCKDCNSSFSELPDWCIPNLRMSKDLYFAIIRDLTEVVSFRMIMRKECISESTIRSVFDSIEILHPSRLPETLCICQNKNLSGLIKVTHF